MGNCQDRRDVEDPQQTRLGRVEAMKIIHHVWNKDFHGLYNYEADRVDSKAFPVIDAIAFCCNQEGGYFMTPQIETTLKPNRPANQPADQSLLRSFNHDNNTNSSPFLQTLDQANPGQKKLPKTSVVFKAFKRNNYFEIKPSVEEEDEEVIQSLLWLSVRSTPQKVTHRVDGNQEVIFLEVSG